MHFPSVVGALHFSFTVLLVRWSDYALFLNFGFCVHSFQIYSRILLPVVSTPLFETPFLVVILPPLYKELLMFLCIFSHFSSPLQRSSVIVLSFLDLKVSQVLFSVIEENLIVLDSRLHCYSCIWFELVVFQVSKASFQFQITKCHHYPHFVLKRSLLVIVTLKNNSDLRLAFFLSFTH